jgi:hypothetical protein
MEQARNYDRTQDISPRQLLILLEVSERTGANLGQLLATGEFESAKTWNDFVRPTIDGGRLGSATGVWQFIPSTFHGIIRRYGGELLVASSADSVGGRERLDLAAGPFSDAQVRAIIRETVEGSRGLSDAHLQLLRHNFAVLAFAKHYLSVETGATTPEEDYLFHFLGEKRGREILSLARGEARHSLSVARSDRATRALAASSRPRGHRSHAQASARVREILIPASSEQNQHTEPKRAILGTVGRSLARPKYGAEAPTDAAMRHGLDRNERSPIRDASDVRAMQSRTWSTREIDIGRPPVSKWALPADSPVVTGNPGMFYRDAKDRSDPYTWAEFMSALSKRVQARRQPALVRAKYGVGFPLNGGDMPERSLASDSRLRMRTLGHEIGGSIVVSEQVLTGPLNTVEKQVYKERLADLIRDGATQPASVYSAPIVLALQRLGLFTNRATDFETYTEGLHEALRSFRAMVGKGEPDDPALIDKVMPAERVALAIYEQRVARYAALQFAQQAVMPHALDLASIRGLLKSHQRASRPHIAELQKALAEEGLETQVRGSRRAPTKRFDGIAGRLTIGSLNRFQLMKGLRQTDGHLDAITTALLGLAPLGSEIFLRPSGAFCPTLDARETLARCRLPAKKASTSVVELLRRGLDHQSWRIGDRIGSLCSFGRPGCSGVPAGHTLRM